MFDHRKCQKLINVAKLTHKGAHKLAVCIKCQQVFDDLGAHVRLKHPDDKSALVGQGTALMQKLFYSKLDEFNKMDSEIVADFQEASKEEPPRKALQRAKTNYTPDIVVDKVLKYAQKLDENGEYPSYLIFRSSPFAARHFVCLLHAFLFIRIFSQSLQGSII